MEPCKTSGCIGLYRLCDWVVFVLNVSAESFGERILPKMERCGLTKFACGLTQVCVCNLDITAQHADETQYADECTVATMMEEISCADNISNQNNIDDIGNFYVKRSGTKSFVVVFVSILNAIAERRYRIAQRFTLTLPVLFGYIPLILDQFS